jgi:tRNA threonylcarbamoyladenosine biosynthesis protein TsaB
MKTVNLLAIDTSMEACSASLLVEGHRYKEYDICPQQHSQKILPMVQALLKQANASLADVHYIIVGRGPGSFTGVRIACGIAQGLAYGAGLKVIGLSTLAAMALATKKDKVAVASDARMGEVYYAEFQRRDNLLAMVSKEQVCAPQIAAASACKFEPDALAGTGWANYPDLSSVFSDKQASVLYPNADSMIDLALQDLANNSSIAVDASDIEPIYVRDTVTWKKLPGR